MTDALDATQAALLTQYVILMSLTYASLLHGDATMDDLAAMYTEYMFDERVGTLGGKELTRAYMLFLDGAAGDRRVSR